MQDGSKDVRSRPGQICYVFIFLSFWAVTCHETHRLLKGDIDGVLLVAICLLVGSIFGIQLLLLVRSLCWIESIKRLGVKKPVPRHSAEDLQPVPVEK